MIKIKAALKLLQELNRIDEQIGGGIRDYSQAAAATDRVAQAIRTDPRIDEDAAVQAMRAATTKERQALDWMVEVTEDARLDAQRQAAVQALVDAGLSSGYHGGWTCLHAGRHLTQVLRALGVLRRCVRLHGMQPWVQERLDDCLPEATRLGVDCEGYVE